MHHAFVLRTCGPGERGNIIAGISPGAELLVKTLRQSEQRLLLATLEKFEKNGLFLNKVPAEQYRRMNRLFEIKAKIDFLSGELLNKNC